MGAIWFRPRCAHNKPTLVQTMAWRQAEGKPLPEATMVWFIDAYIGHPTQWHCALSLWEGEFVDNNEAEGLPTMSPDSSQDHDDFIWSFQCLYIFKIDREKCNSILSGCAISLCWWKGALTHWNIGILTLVHMIDSVCALSYIITWYQCNIVYTLCNHDPNTMPVFQVFT